ncbi:MAG: DUF503 domain-containing protein [Firmicutes bacterium]|nr:DUF503 domain-containing protein [Bacillota bacterium]
MLTGVCRLELHLMDGASLKEKRKVIRSIIDRLKSRFNISIAEVGSQDLHRMAEIGLAIVGNETAYLDKVIDKAINFIDNDARVQIVSIDKNIF